MNKKLLLVLVLFGFGVYLLAGHYWYEHQRPTGDEPHYLIIAQSLVFDHDLDLKNNYDNRDYQKWGYPTENLDRHVSVNSRSPHEYSVHNIGWPLVFSPFFALSERLAIKILTSIIATLLLLNIFLLVFKKTKNNWLAIISSLVIGFSPPILIYSTQIFNEIFAALLILYAFRKIIEKPQTWPELVFSMLAIAYLPWLHVKYLIISIVLLVLWVVNNFRDKKKLALSLIYLVSLSLLGYFFWLWYGNPLPNAQYPMQLTFNLLKIFQGGLALFFDKTFGILPYAPVFLFVVPGLYFLYQKEKSVFWIVSIVFLSLFLIQAAGVTYIGWAPAGRFLTPILPLLALPLAFAYKNLQRWGKVVFWLFAFWGWFSGFYLIRHPDVNYSLSEPKFLQIFSPKLFDLTKLFPKLLEVERYPILDHKNILPVLGWVLIIFIFTYVLIRNSKRS